MSEMQSPFHNPIGADKLPVLLPEQLPDPDRVTVPLIIPAYEPDERMLPLLQGLAGYGDLIVIVNDGSGPEYDHYYEEARKMGCVILVHPVNQGKGRALKDAFAVCLANFPNMAGVITADSDGQHCPGDIARIREGLLSHRDSLVLGCRDFSGAGIPWKSTFGNTLTRNVCRLCCGVRVSDTQTGLRGIPAAFMRELSDVEGERFEFETRMLIATKDRYPIHEILIETIYDSAENHQTHFDPVKDSIRIYRIFGERFARFLVSSLSSCLIDLILFTVFCHFLAGSSLRLPLSTVMARVISAAYNYLINHRLVFRSREKYGPSAVKYLLLAAAQMCCSALLVTLLCSLLPMIHPTIVKCIVDTVLFFVSYQLQRRFVFRA